jgi:hypothetical protein
MTPLTSHQSEFPGCNVQGKIEGKPAEMVIDSGFTRTLLHKRYFNPKSLTGNRITVLTAAGDRIVVPLAWVGFESKQGKYTELVGVMDRLPVDCLLGRSSFGKTLTRQNVLDQWERNVNLSDKERGEAFVMTRRQKALEEVQHRANQLIDRENELAAKSLAKREVVNEGPEEGDLHLLFGNEEGNLKPNRVKEKNSDSKTDGNSVPINILDRTRSQLIADQKSDVNLDKFREGVENKAPEDSDGYF